MPKLKIGKILKWILANGATILELVKSIKKKKRNEFAFEINPAAG